MIALALAIALGGGVASVWYALDHLRDLGTVELGEWRAEPFAGTTAADPYAQARLARAGLLLLGASEGTVFVAARDSAGRPLDVACDYVVSGPPPLARIWTLHAAPETVAGEAGQMSGTALHSQGLLRNGDGTFEIHVSHHPMPGNWLQLRGADRFRIVLSAYDTPGVGLERFIDVTLPSIRRQRCDA